MLGILGYSMNMSFFTFHSREAFHIFYSYFSSLLGPFFCRCCAYTFLHTRIAERALQSFLLRMLKEELGKPFGPRGACWFRWRSLIKAFTRSRWVVVIRFAFCALLKCCWRKQNDGKNDAPGQPEEMEAGSSSHCWPGWSCIRTSTPPSQRQFVFVEFNAWECAGSEVLWAALITKIFDTVSVSGFRRSAT